MPRRLLTLYRELRRLIAAHRPAEAAVEKLFFGRNTTTAISVGQARGVVLLALAEAGVPVAEYTPAEVKQALAGFGRAQKAQMQRMIQAILDLPDRPQPGRRRRRPGHRHLPPAPEPAARPGPALTAAEPLARRATDPASRRRLRSQRP